VFLRRVAPVLTALNSLYRGQRSKVRVKRLSGRLLIKRFLLLSFRLIALQLSKLARGSKLLVFRWRLKVSITQSL
jgi:hypothetical protein